MDEKIIQAVLEGRKEEFNNIIERYYNELFVFVHNQVNNIETTKDLLQEIFMHLFTKLHKYDSNKASFRTWMYKVSSNYLINYFRKNKVQEVIYEDFNMFADNEKDILQEMIQKDDVSSILHIMKKILNKKHYQVMMLHFFSEVTVDEIADSLSIAPKTVRNIIALSIHKIKDFIGGETHE